jgi:integration host factor subunit alpha
MYYKGLLQSEEVCMTITKAELAEKVAGDCGFMKGEAIEIIEKLLEIMKTRLAAGEDVMISGFGKWNVKSKHARRGRNPQTGKEMVLDARRVITWKYSPRLKVAVNKVSKGLKR